MIYIFYYILHYIFYYILNFSPPLEPNSAKLIVFKEEIETES